MAQPKGWARQKPIAILYWQENCPNQSGRTNCKSNAIGRKIAKTPAYAGYHETRPHWGIVHYTVYYFTGGCAECQAKIGQLQEKVI
jgi:hypothetical protein